MPSLKQSPMLNSLGNQRVSPWGTSRTQKSVPALSRGASPEEDTPRVLVDRVSVAAELLEGELRQPPRESAMVRGANAARPRSRAQAQRAGESPALCRNRSVTRTPQIWKVPQNGEDLLARRPKAYRGDPTNSPRTKAAGTEAPSPDGRNKDLLKRIIEKQSRAAEVAPMPPPAPDATDLANAPGSAGHLAIEDGFAEGTDWEHLRDGSDRELGRTRAAAEGGSASSSSSQTPTMNKDAHDVACEQNSDSPPSKRIRRGIGVDSMRGSPVAFRRWLEVMCQSG